MRMPGARSRSPGPHTRRRGRDHSPAYSRQEPRQPGYRRGEHRLMPLMLAGRSGDLVRRSAAAPIRNSQPSGMMKNPAGTIEAGGYPRTSQVAASAVERAAIAGNAIVI
ncbi:MAG: hypothetical protein MZV63_17265 [Marinilabiliales bacterium]|nr:hypothetical protein [Marinilabiliales bacterium]